MEGDDSVMIRGALSVLMLSLGGWGTVSAETPDAVQDTMATDNGHDIRWSAEGMVSTASTHTPFWLMNNRMGLSSIDKNNGYIRGTVQKFMTHDKPFSWGAGVDLAVPYGFTSRFVVQQFYGEIRYRSLQLTVGAKERTEGLVNQELGSGDMLFSPNSRPLPQAYLSMPRYEYVPFTRHWLSIKGFFSMGMATDGGWQKTWNGEDGKWTEHQLFHSKGVFFRVSNPRNEVLTWEGGLAMATQFGGTAHVLREDENGVFHPVVISMGHGFKDIMHAILPTGGGDSGDQWQDGERSNMYGNHVGEWSTALTFKHKESGWGVKGYYEHYFDDQSQMVVEHLWKDMLLGGEITLPENRFVSQIVYEYLYTKDQSGAVYWDRTDDIPEQVSGRDDYYNHYIYNGYEHWGMGMGNPLLISPIYNGRGDLSFRHNRIKGHHIGFKGSPMGELSYKVLMSYTRSWGTYFNPTERVRNNFNALLELDYHPARLQGWSGRVSLGLDGGNLLGHSVGAMLTISKSGWIR